MRLVKSAAFVAAAMLLAACNRAEKAVEQKAESAAQAVESEAHALAAREAAIDAYIYAYPLVTMELTRRVMTNAAAPDGEAAPMGQFVRKREYPNASFRAVTAPNADTLYTTTWLDVSKEPWVLSLPDMKDRYFLFPMLDGWTNVFQVPGKRTTGTGPQVYAITGPGWSGTLPEGVTEYKSPTGMVWILGRIYCTGTADDYAAVHALQDQVQVVPLSSYGKPYAPPAGAVDPAIDTKTAVREQVDALDGAAYFALFAQLLKTNPPAAEDAPMVAKLAQLGIVPGQDFAAAKLDPAVAQGIAEAPKPAQSKIMSWLKEGILTRDMKLEDGWLYTTNAGVYGTSYRQRALVTAIGLGANRPQDAIYPSSTGPDLLEKYSGANKYVMHFPKDQTPPVRGFWSVTMYGADYFFVDNPLNRYTLSERDALKTNADGSTDLYIQHESPGSDKESNWLPAPEGPFVLMMRLYWPSDAPPSLLDGSWKIPGVKQAS
ncbi:MAG TPA: DUF1254 domain-containing protein [Myxococcota bacterium]|nr:DUF1254 domain-containing protein [Myxococcota bacterium]